MLTVFSCSAYIQPTRPCAHTRAQCMAVRHFSLALCGRRRYCDRTAGIVVIVSKEVTTVCVQALSARARAGYDATCKEQLVVTPKDTPEHSQSLRLAQIQLLDMRTTLWLAYLSSGARTGNSFSAGSDHGFEASQRSHFMSYRLKFEFELKQFLPSARMSSA